jgi:hypothetical protein
MEPMQWLIGLYNFGMMNLLDTLHFGRSKNFGLCVNHIFSYVHGGIIWMDTLVQIYVALISKITGLSTINVQPEEYIANKAHKKEISELIKAQFGTSGK